MKQLSLYVYLGISLLFANDAHCSSKERFCCLLKKLNHIFLVDSDIENTLNAVNVNALELPDCDQNVIMISQADIPLRR